jgi:hypothetical protein
LPEKARTFLAVSLPLSIASNVEFMFKLPQSPWDQVPILFSSILDTRNNYTKHHSHVFPHILFGRKMVRL